MPPGCNILFLCQLRETQPWLREASGGRWGAGTAQRQPGRNQTPEKGAQEEQGAQGEQEVQGSRGHRESRECREQGAGGAGLQWEQGALGSSGRAIPLLPALG